MSVSGVDGVVLFLEMDGWGNFKFSFLCIGKSKNFPRQNQGCEKATGNDFPDTEQIFPGFLSHNFLHPF